MPGGMDAKLIHLWFAMPGTMPAAMGLALASYVLCHIAGQPVGDKPAKAFLSFNVINKLHSRLERTAQKLQGVAYVHLCCSPLHNPDVRRRC